MPATVLDLELPAAASRLTTPFSRAKTFPQGPPKPQVVPFPKTLETFFTAEWETFMQTRHHTRVIDKFYRFPDLIMKKLKVPLVDTSVVVVFSAPTLPSEGAQG